MQITFHGELAKQYGSTHWIEASSVREALDALSRQLRIYADIFIDRRPLLRIVGHSTQESLDKYSDKIDVVPALLGGGGVIKAVIGSLLVVVGSIVPGLQFLVPMGIGLALTGISQIFTKAPSLSKNQDPDASKYLGLGNNTTKLGTLRSYSMGRVKITSPHIIAVNVDSNELVKGEFPV